MRALSRKGRADMLSAAQTARVVVGIFGDTERCSFEPRVLADVAELDAAISRREFVGIVAFLGIPPRIVLAVYLDSKAQHAFDALVSSLTATAVQDARFWQPRVSRLARLSGSRTIEAR
jgi:hypothetical protein